MPVLARCSLSGSIWGEGMSRKAIFMDIDGTLMENGRVSQHVIETIQQARAQGHLFFVCTGRSFGNLPKALLEADYLDGYVMGCGMHCVHGDRVVFRQRVPYDQVLAVARYFFEQQRELLCEGENRMIALHTGYANFESFDALEAFEGALRSTHISKLTVTGPYREDDALFLSQWFDIYDMGTYSDVVVSGVTKATGMQRMLDYLGIAREHCIGIGDSANDLPMIEFAGLGVAMGNAPEGVKARADVVTECVENDGVAVMIEKYILNR